MEFQSCWGMMLSVEFDVRSLNMIAEVFITAAILAALFGMVASTEQVLSRREEYVVIDERMTEHRSRM